MQKRVLCVSLLLLFTVSLSAEADESNAAGEYAYPLCLFHDFGKNWLGSVSRHYGLNLIGGGLATWFMIETGVDSWWRNVAEDNQWLVKTGRPALFIGEYIPVVTPVALYITGWATDNRKLKSTAAALTQALLITLSIQTPLKMITGRGSTGLFSGRSPQEGEDFSRKFDLFNMDFVRGWPSGHTANSFAAAAVLSEMYSDVLWLKIVSYSYAAIMGACMASSVHWLSDVVAGALIGYAVGKTVGKSYARPHERKSDMSPSLDFSANMIEVSFRI